MITNIKAREQSQLFYLRDIDLASLKKEYIKQDNLLSDLKAYLIMYIINNNDICNEIKAIYDNNKNQEKKLIGGIFKEIIVKHTPLDFELSMIFHLILNAIHNEEIYQELIILLRLA